MHSLNILHATSSMVQNIKFIKYRENKLTSQSMFKMSATGMNTSPQAHLLLVNCVHQSAPALSRATHAVDAVTAHRCHELWSHTHVAE